MVFPYVPTRFPSVSHMFSLFFPICFHVRSISSNIFSHVLPIEPAITWGCRNHGRPIVAEAARPLLEDFLASCDYVGLDWGSTEWLVVDLDGWKLGKAERIFGEYSQYTYCKL